MSFPAILDTCNPTLVFQRGFQGFGDDGFPSLTTVAGDLILRGAVHIGWYPFFSELLLLFSCGDCLQGVCCLGEVSGGH